MAVATSAEGRSSVFTCDKPPFEKPCIKISSALNSVGWNTTLMPLLSTHSVASMSSLKRNDLILPLRGTFFTSSVSMTSSAGASIANSLCPATAAKIACSDGICTSVFSGPEIATVGFAWMSALATWFTVSSDTIGSTALTKSYSHAKPGMDSPSSKLRMHSRASVMFLRVLRSLYCLVIEFSFSLFTRSNSALVKP